MASRFGGIPVEESGSRFGGMADDTAPTAPKPSSPEPRQESGLSAQQKLIQAYRAGSLNPRQKQLVEELAARNEIDLAGTEMPVINRDTERQRAMQELAQDQNWLQTLGISIGKGLTNVGRGLGLVEEPGKIETEAYEALEKERPMTTATGEIIGEAAPFLPAGAAAGGFASLPARMAAGTAVGAAEGGILAEDKAKGALVGGGLGLGAEVLFPVVGRLGNKVFRRVTGKAPSGAMLTPEGKPTTELQQALDQAGMTYEDLTQDAAEVIRSAEAGAVPGQVARAARFAEEGVPATKGEITQDFPQQHVEQRLLHSAGEAAAEPFRQFKLRQSRAVENVLRDLGGEGFDKETTGELIKEALLGRKNYLRSTKNQLYEQAAEAADEIGSVPVIGDEITAAIPDPDTMEDLAITAPQAMSSLDKLLTKYGLKEPTAEAAQAGFEPTPLTIKNFERFRKSLNAIERGDQTGASAVAIGPVKEALDNELDNLAASLKEAGYSEDIIEPLKKARETTKTLKTEFAPQDIAAKIADARKNGGAAQITEASRVYDKLTGAGSKVEEIRRLTSQLQKAGEKGQEALGAMQSTAILDLIDGGFTTKSMKVSGENVFNPTAFKNRLAKLNKDGKLDALFANRPEVLKKLKNLDKIASDMIPPNQAVPKGSAATAYFQDLLNNIAVSKLPGGAFLLGMFRNVTEPVKTARTVKKATEAVPEVVKTQSMLQRQFPGISTALGIPVVAQEERGQE